jgi:holo-[acyl-carrier protein] synthase
MPIVGIGTDLCDIRRIARLLERHGTRFTTRVFTAHEQAVCEAKANPAAAYARRFAAKEAALKALGTGLTGGLFWTDIEVRNNAHGAPSLTFYNEAEKRRHARGATAYLSVSDEPPYALAFVVLEHSV